MSNEPLLKLSKFKELFEVYRNASQYAIDDILMQKDLSVIHKIKKLNEIESQWPTHEKELFAILYYIKKIRDITWACTI